MQGKWRHITSNKEKLTCSLIMNESNHNFSFLMSNELNGGLKVNVTIAGRDFPQSFNENNMRFVKLGSKCNLMVHQGVVYTIN